MTKQDQPRGSRFLIDTYRKQEPVFTHGEGMYLFDQNGNRFLDLVAGLAVNALGYGHPAVVSAITEQSRRFIHVSNAYTQEPQEILAELLCRQTGMDRLFFSNSGTEAFEASLKIARKWGMAEGRTRVIGFSGGFHGRTYAALSVMAQTKYRDGFGPFLPHCGVLPFNDVDSLVASVDEDVVAVVLEVIQGESGIHEASPDFLNAIDELRNKFGFLVIFDEIQTGIGRTGHFLASEAVDLQPDIVLLAKAIGGGLPLGATLVRANLSDVLIPGSHGSTFGGNPVACAAGRAVVEFLVQENIMAQVIKTGDRLKTGLEALRKGYPQRVRDVRGRGLMLGLELTDDAEAFRMGCLSRGVLVNITGGSVVRLLPPLILNEAQCIMALEVFTDVLSTLPS